MSQPNRKAELEEQYFNLHIKAGLFYAGKNAEGDDEWIGTKSQWETYETLENEQ